MESVFFHPKVVHLPLALALLMPLISTVLAVAWWRGWFSMRTWALAVGLQVVLVGSAWQAIETGEHEEDRVEQVVSHDLIHEHEEAAEGFMWAGVVVLLLMAAALGLARKKAGLPLAAVSVVGTLVAAGLAIRTGQLGGELVYVHGAASAYVGDGGGSAGSAGGEGHEDGSDEHDH